MAVMILHKVTGIPYVLLGTGYGAYKIMMPSLFGGSAFPHEESAEFPMAAVSDRYGHIHWFRTEELQVMEVDGREVIDYFEKHDALAAAAKAKSADVWEEACPACHFRIMSNAIECPSCGLALLSVENSDEQER
jgi:hypothetical protein